jgi:hypothetical protein
MGRPRLRPKPHPRARRPRRWRWPRQKQVPGLTEVAARAETASALARGVGKVAAVAARATGATDEVARVRAAMHEWPWPWLACRCCRTEAAQFAPKPSGTPLLLRVSLCSAEASVGMGRCRACSALQVAGVVLGGEATAAAAAVIGAVVSGADHAAATVIGAATSIGAGEDAAVHGASWHALLPPSQLALLRV